MARRRSIARRHGLPVALALLFAVLPLGACSPGGAAPDRVEISAADDFSRESLLRGVRSTAAQCRALGDRVVWARVDDALAECLRYWSHGLAERSGRVIVFIHGDRLAGDRVIGVYETLSHAQLERDARRWSAELQAPYVYLSRPGTHGSSGDHTRRRTLEEARLLSAALDALKQRHGIDEFVLVGQSGGGHLVASALTLRSDIVCAVAASSPNSPRLRYLAMGRDRDTTNLESYEPAQHLARAALHPKLRVVIAGDPRDRNVPWDSQMALVEPLERRGVAHVVVETVGLGPDFHRLDDPARRIAGLCHHGAPFYAIQRIEPALEVARR